MAVRRAAVIPVRLRHADVPTGGGTAQWSLPVPRTNALFGLTFFVQAQVADADANVAGATISNGATLVIGW
ncbi:MAG: hypothetical protein KDC98_20565 [Planctomycetes bacterium]|nr:hypothetical protein [Planctomycetota bacterium]